MQPIALPEISGAYRKVAIFGGAYNNWLAVQATLADARAQGAEAVWFLGDAGGFGPHPDRVVELLRGTPGLGLVQGNYDDSVGRGLDDCQCGYTDPEDNRYAQLSYDYTLSNTSGENRDFLKAMPKSGAIMVGGHRVHLCHGSPRQVNEFLWESTTPAGFVRALCDSVAAQLVVCTHTGLFWERRLPDGRGVLNVGAVGRPANDGRQCVWYAMLEAVEGRLVSRFVPVTYDWQRLAGEMEAEGLPAAFVETITTGWWTTCLEVLPSRERSLGRH